MGLYYNNELLDYFLYSRGRDNLFAHLIFRIRDKYRNREVEDAELEKSIGNKVPEMKQSSAFPQSNSLDGS